MGGPGSGRPLTPEARENRRQGNRAVTEAARRSRGAGTMHDDPDDGTIDPERIPPAPNGRISDEELLALLPGSNPYDKAVLRSRGRFTYLDGKTREQVKGEELNNERKQAEIAKERGDLLTRDQVRQRDDAIDGLWCDQLRTVHQLLGEILPPDRLLAAQKAADRWIKDVRERMAEQVESIK